MPPKQPPPFVRKSSAPWDRLRPVKQDPLEAMGFVSKGDKRLLDVRTQESFYQTIVTRYMQFCTIHKRDLDNAFASLTLNEEGLAISNPSQKSLSTPDDKTISQSQRGIANSSTASRTLSSSRWATPSPPPSLPTQPMQPPLPAPAPELTRILLALRKLREALLSTTSTTPTPQTILFSQRVHIFNIRLAILALHPESYHPSLNHLLFILHSRTHPLPIPELNETTTYLILDLALRQQDIIAAYTLRHKAKTISGYQSRQVDRILRAVVTGNWVAFWRIRREVDGYIRALMYWYIEPLRKSTLKVFGRAYLKVEVGWVLRSVGGGEMEWEELVRREGVGWALERDGVTGREMVVIRKPKVK